MILSLILFAMAGAIAYFHYVQGLFSATASAIFAAVAAVLALGWYEQVAPFLFKISFFDQAASISLVVIFAVAYIIPRLVFDSFIPGNVRVPVIMDKVGAGVMGLIAGLIGTGIVAVATDALPFGNTVGMYSRFAVSDKPGQYMGPNGQNQDSNSFDVVASEKLDPDDPGQSHLWFRQDDLVVGLVKRVSDESGSMSMDHPFASIHPDLLDELYGERIGIQTGAKHSAVTTDQNQAVSVKGIWAVSKPLPQVDGVVNTMRGGDQPPSPTLVADADQIAIVVRMSFAGKDIADEADNMLRFSAGSVRFVAGQPDNNIPFKDYYPVATLDPKGVAVACRPDDFLVADLGTPRTIDLIFVVDRDHVISGDKPNPPFPLPSGTFIEFKRYSTADLSGKTVDYGPSSPNTDKTYLLRTKQITDLIAKTDGVSLEGSPSPTIASPSSSGGTSTGGAVAPTSGGGTSSDTGSTSPAPTASASIPPGKPLGDSGLSFADISVSNKLVAPINPGMGNDAGTVQLTNGVGGELAHRQWQSLTVTSDTAMTKLGAGDDSVQELGVDPNMVLVQVECTPPVSGSSSEIWAWGKRVSDFALADATGKTYKCVGAWATIQRSAEHYLVVNYMDFDDQNHLQPITSQKGRPVQVWLAFEVPAGTPIAEIRFSANTAIDNLNFKAQ